MRLLRFIFCFLILGLPCMPIVFAWSGDFIDDNSGTGTLIDEEAKKREQEKIMDDMNAFLIDTYKIKLEATLQRLERGIKMASEGNEATTYLLYKKVNDEIAQKVEKINNSAISPNRRKILLSVFGYIRSQIEEKMKALSANTNKE